MKKHLIALSIALITSSFAHSDTLDEVIEKQISAAASGNPGIPAAAPASLPPPIPSASVTSTDTTPKAKGAAIDQVILVGVWGVGDDLNADVIHKDWNAAVSMKEGQFLYGWRLSKIQRQSVIFEKVKLIKSKKSTREHVAEKRELLIQEPYPSVVADTMFSSRVFGGRDLSSTYSAMTGATPRGSNGAIPGYRPR